MILKRIALRVDRTYVSMVVAKTRAKVICVLTRLQGKGGRIHIHIHIYIYRIMVDSLDKV